MSVEVLRLAAFTTDPDAGNPAGVVIGDEHPPRDEMQRVAAEVGFSETAFLRPSGRAQDGRPRWDVRYFTPTTEIDFCGHATIAAAAELGRRHGPGRFLFEIRAGTVPVSAENSGTGRRRAALTSPAVTLDEASDAVVEQALTWLRWTRSDLDPERPPVVGSAGAPHLLLFLRERFALADLRMDRERLAALCRDQGWVGVYCLWARADDRYDARNAAPAVGIDEDPGTGAAAAVLGGHLRATGVVEPGATVTIVQGEDMGRRCDITVRPRADDPGVDVAGDVAEIPPTSGR